MDLICDMTSRSKHFMIIGVNATGRYSLKQDGTGFFGTGTMMAALKHAGTVAWFREVLKTSVKTSFSSSAQSFSTRPVILSGPVALRELIVANVLFTLAVERHRG